MIVLDRPHGLRLFLALRGSILPRILGPLAACTALAVMVTLSHGFLFEFKVTLTPVPFTLIGLALAIFLGFRNSTAYDRYWEARCLWGEAVQGLRALARQWLTLVEPGAEGERPFVLGLIAWAHALRHQLRGSDPGPELRALLPAGAGLVSVLSARQPAEALLRQLGGGLGAALREGRVPPALGAEIDRGLVGLARVQAGCERIRGTPIPFAYTLLLHRTASVYCFLLPFGLIDQLGWMTPLVVLVVAYTFFGLDALGDEIEQPFGLSPHHLPLSALCRGIEIDLREALGDQPLPAPLQPEDGCLL